MTTPPNARDLLRQLIRDAANPRPEAVTVAGLGTLYIRVQTALDARRARALLRSAPDDDYETGRILASLLCDPDGVALFDATSEADVKELSALPGPIVQAIFAEHHRINLVTTEAVHELGNGSPSETDT